MKKILMFLAIFAIVFFQMRSCEKSLHDQTAHVVEVECLTDSTLVAVVEINDSTLASRHITVYSNFDTLGYLVDQHDTSSVRLLVHQCSLSEYYTLAEVTVGGDTIAMY